MRFDDVEQKKRDGVVYTPEALARFIAQRLLAWLPTERLASSADSRLTLYDPAVGDGALLHALAVEVIASGQQALSIRGGDIDADALEQAAARLDALDRVTLEERDFLVGALDFAPDLLIANPPYVRTQILGAEVVEDLRARFGLTGRIDLSHAFLLRALDALAPGGVAAIITSNRFMTVRAGEKVRARLRAEATLREIWDLGDSKLFDAAVLPVVLIFEKRKPESEDPLASFTSVYEVEPAVVGQEDAPEAESVLEALAYEGGVFLPDDRAVLVRKGVLAAAEHEGDIWRGVSEEEEAWLEQVASNTWKRFGDIGKIKVGVKSCADAVFLRDDWDTLDVQPELLRPVITHHIARRFVAKDGQRQLLYPHQSTSTGRQPAPLSSYPETERYLEQHRERLEGRSYLIDAGRQWYELWVAHDPAQWDEPKLVWRDIVDEPTFWVDTEGAVVNGDCYWMCLDKGVEEEVLWLALAVANASLTARFYDLRFNNKLYAGRRRFITQYVKHFPLPDPSCESARELIELARDAHDQQLEVDPQQLDALVQKAFGLQ